MRLALVVLALSPALAAADPHPMASGASPAPTASTDIAMTAETLTISIDLREARVNAAVTLVNTGAATALDVGFPCATGDDAGQIDVPCKVPLTVTANGKAVRTSADKPGKKQTHWVWHMKLAANESVPLVVTYRAPLVNPRYDIPAQGMGLFTYRLTTGAQWAGPIGKLQIEVDHVQDALLFVSPKGYQREAGKITWTFENYEPTEEVVIVPSPIAGMQMLAALHAKTASDMRKNLEAGDYKKAEIDAVIKALDAAGAGDVRWVQIISRLGGVPAPSPEQVKAVTDESRKLLEAIAARAKR